MGYWGDKQDDWVDETPAGSKPKPSLRQRQSETSSASARPTDPQYQVPGHPEYRIKPRSVAKTPRSQVQGRGRLGRGMSADQDRHSRAGKRSSRWDPATYEPEEENPYTLMARRVWRGSFDWIVVIAVALLVGTQIKAHVVESYRIPSESMEPTLIKEDRVIVNKLTYNVTDFHRGDVVVFTTPPAGDPRIKNYIKRIIGLPGDVLESKNGLLYINGKIAKEPYLPANVNTVTLTDQQSLPKIEVPNGTLWVMGDNREHSGDSREFGPIAKDTVVGQAVLRYQLFSPGRFGLL